jgi:predicted short-subunit dehydrogenase-like oxidoreductase (DUF2520 family)
MISIIILGTGNVAKHLFDAFIVQKSVKITQVYGRNPESLSYFEGNTKVTSDISQIKEADILLIALSDDAIAEVSKKLHNKKGLIVHTSGSLALDALPQNSSHGVFYPLQTFSKERPINFKEIPICIEAQTDEDYELLKQLAKSISDNVQGLDSNQRKALHLAAVFANNFTNHMYHAAQEICEQNRVRFELLHPLIRETAAKALAMSPHKAQTGPARRNNDGTIGKQLNQLQDEKLKTIYSLLSKSIRKTYGEKL